MCCCSFAARLRAARCLALSWLNADTRTRSPLSVLNASGVVQGDTQIVNKWKFLSGKIREAPLETKVRISSKGEYPWCCHTMVDGGILRLVGRERAGPGASTGSARRLRLAGLLFVGA